MGQISSVGLPEALVLLVLAGLVMGAAWRVFGKDRGRRERLAVLIRLENAAEIQAKFGSTGLRELLFELDRLCQREFRLGATQPRDGGHVICATTTRLSPEGAQRHARHLQGVAQPGL